MSSFVKTHELRSKSRSDLTQQLGELKNELSSLRVQKISSGSANKVAKIKHVRKSIARILTVVRQADREEVSKTCKGKKNLPKDLRAKKTRAIRRRLTAFEASRQTVRQHKKALQNKPRLYALKA